MIPNCLCALFGGSDGEKDFEVWLLRMFNFEPAMWRAEHASLVRLVIRKG